MWLLFLKRFVVFEAVSVSGIRYPGLGIRDWGLGMKDEGIGSRD